MADLGSFATMFDLEQSDLRYRHLLDIGGVANRTNIERKIKLISFYSYH